MLKNGVSGPFAKQWQLFLNQQGFNCGNADGDFGSKTEQSTKDFQTSVGIAADGEVGHGTFLAAVATGNWPSPDGYPIILSKGFTTASRGLNDIYWVVLHTMEVPQAAGMAVEISSRFGADTSPTASTHFCVDDQVAVQNVQLKDVAWHAENANRKGIGIEHAGSASSTDWTNDYSTAMFKLSATVTADMCKRYSLPVVWLDAEAVKRGDKGITDHATVNDAFIGVGKGHRDVGESWPRDSYIALVNEAFSKL